MDTDRFVPSVLRGFTHSRDRPLPLNHLHYPTNWFLQSLNRTLYNLETIIMPSKSTRNASKRPWPETRFVDIRLDKKQQDLFREFMEKKADDLSLALADFIADGNKTSITWDDENKTFIVASTCKNPDSINLDACISSRSQDWYEALMLNVFKHLVICGAGEWEGESRDKSWG